MFKDYVQVYQGEVTAGGTDGDLVSSGGEFTSPISITLGSGDYQIIPLAIRNVTTYTVGNVIIYSNDPTNLQLSLTGEDDTWADDITVGTVDTTNILFYARFNLNPETLHETPRFKIEYLAPVAMPYLEPLVSWYPFKKDIAGFYDGTVPCWRFNRIFSGTETTHSVSSGAMQGTGNNDFPTFTIDASLGGKDFTIDGWAYFDPACSQAPNIQIFEITYWSNYTTTSYARIYKPANSNRLAFDSIQTTSITNTDVVEIDVIGRLFHWEIDYSYSSKTWTFFVDGVKVATQKAYSISKRALSLTFGQKNFFGAIDEVRIFNEVTLHTANFTPPMPADYKVWWNRLSYSKTYADDCDVEFILPSQGDNPVVHQNTSLKLTLGYNGTVFKRDLTFNDLDPETMPPASEMKAKIQAVNSSVASGTDDGMVNFFTIDDYQVGDTLGTFKGIDVAEITTVSRINLDD